MKIFVSIPKILDSDAIIEHGDMVKAKLSRKGHEVVSDRDIYSGNNPTPADIVCDRLRALSSCDAIYLCEGWTDSKICRIEYCFAKEFGKKLIQEGNREISNYYFDR